MTTGACVSLSMQKAWLLQDGKVVYGQAWVDVTKENMKEYPF